MESSASVRQTSSRPFARPRHMSEPSGLARIDRNHVPFGVPCQNCGKASFYTYLWRAGNKYMAGIRRAELRSASGTRWRQSGAGAVHNYWNQRSYGTLNPTSAPILNGKQTEPEHAERDGKTIRFGEHNVHTKIRSQTLPDYSWLRLAWQYVRRRLS